MKQINTFIEQKYKFMKQIKIMKQNLKNKFRTQKKKIIKPKFIKQI